MTLRLTDEQRALVTSSYPMVYSFLRHHHLPSDYIGACEEGLCKAALTFDRSLGVWSSWAYLKMLGEVRLEMRHEYKQLGGCTLESWADAGEHLDVSVPEVSDVIERLAAELEPREKQILHLSLEDKNQKDIAKVMGISQPHVSRLKKRIGQICKEMMNE